jgi:hypothetical protein
VDEKRAACESAIATSPDCIEAFDFLFKVELHAGNFADALAVVDRWIAAHPSSLDAAQLRCMLLVDLNRLEDAAREATALAASRDDAHGAHVQLARVAVRANDRDGCIAHLLAGEDAFERSKHHEWTDYVADEVLRFPELESVVDQVPEWQATPESDGR